MITERAAYGDLENFTLGVTKAKQVKTSTMG